MSKKEGKIKEKKGSREDGGGKNKEKEAAQVSSTR